MFGTFDYLPRIIDSMLDPDSPTLTLLAVEGDMLVAMSQAREMEPGDWFLRGLRSNSKAGPTLIGAAISALIRDTADYIRRHGARQVRYGTLETFDESRRLGQLLGFEEGFRIWHTHLGMPDSWPDPGLQVARTEPTEDLLDYFRQGSCLAEGYYFTWWYTRRLRLASLREASERGLLLEMNVSGERRGAALFHYVDWSGLFVFCLVEAGGDDEALLSLYWAGLNRARKMGANAVGIVHPSRAEALRRQELLGAGHGGAYTVQLVRRID